MVVFEDIQDVEEWLEPLGYAAFWRAVLPWAIFGPRDKAHCDRLTKSGEVREDAVLAGLKVMARVELASRLGLEHRIHDPVDRQYLMSTH
ncbi:MAG: hypothetical protein AAGD13_14945 [Pseudomonadota bacterium]